MRFFEAELRRLREENFNLKRELDRSNFLLNELINTTSTKNEKIEHLESEIIKSNQTIVKLKNDSEIMMKNLSIIHAKVDLVELEAVKNSNGDKNKILDNVLQSIHIIRQDFQKLVKNDRYKELANKSNDEHVQSSSSFIDENRVGSNSSSSNSCSIVREQNQDQSQQNLYLQTQKIEPSIKKDSRLSSLVYRIQRRSFLNKMRNSLSKKKLIKKRSESNGVVEAAKSVTELNSKILKNFPIILEHDVDSKNFKRRDYEKAFKSKIMNLTCNQHILISEQDKRVVINDNMVRIFYHCNHKECSAKFVVLIDLINEKAGIYTNIANLIMNHQGIKNADHDYCVVLTSSSEEDNDDVSEDDFEMKRKRINRVCQNLSLNK